MRERSALILALLVMAVSAYAAIGAIGWPLKTALFPLVISIPLFCLAAAEVAAIVLSGARLSPAKGLQPPTEASDPPAARRTLVTIGWILGFFAVILLLGFLVAVPIFVLLYLRLQGRESWVVSIAMTLAVSGLFYGLFDLMLHLPFSAGWLFSWFGPSS